MPKRTTQLDLVRRMTPKEQRRYYAALQAHLKDDKPAAMAGYKRILDKNPKCWPARYSIALLAHHLLEHDWAVQQLATIVEAVPGFVEAWFNYGTILQTVGRYAEAEPALRRAIALAPDFTGAWTNLGNALLGLGRTEDAEAAFTTAMGLTPENPEAAWNLAHVLIMTGRWVEGWDAYETRWQVPGFSALNSVEVAEDRMDAPRHWPKGASLMGKTLVVTEEQGYGDLFMCLRYAPRLRSMGAAVIWSVRPECLRLVQASVSPDRVVSIRDQVPTADYLISCMSLHARLGITPDNVPGADGYLYTRV